VDSQPLIEPAPRSLAAPRPQSQAMGSFLILSSHGRDAGNTSEWSFSGAEDLELRGCLDRLGDFVASGPDESTAAIVFGSTDNNYGRPMQGRALKNRERAWTVEGALRLAEILPDSLANLRGDLRRRFSHRARGFLAASGSAQV
jgi:hypothetical protein